MVNALPAFNMADLDLLPRDPALTVKAYSMLQGTDTLLILAEARSGEAQLYADYGDKVMADHDADIAEVTRTSQAVAQDTLAIDHVNFGARIAESGAVLDQVNNGVVQGAFVNDLARKTAADRSIYTGPTTPGGAPPPSTPSGPSTPHPKGPAPSLPPRRPLV